MASIFVFGILILVHELGHFATAKLVGMRVDEFAIGFGKKLFSRQHGATLYSLRLIPLGGFNKIAGMDPDEEQDEQSFSAKPIWARMLVIVAGSTMNFILPIVLMTIVFFAAGIDTASDKPIVGHVFPDKPAARAGLLAGDRITSVNNQAIASWQQFVTAIQASEQKALHIAYEREGSAAILTIMPEFDTKANRSIVGVMPVIDNYQPGLLESIKLAVAQTGKILWTMVIGLWQMVSGEAPADVAGPLGVAQMAGEVAQLGILPLLQFAALLSLNIGLLNLLPIPVLDGGHIVALAIEGVRGKPLNKDKLQIVQMIGFALLLGLMLLATFKDIAKLKLF